MKADDFRAAVALMLFWLVVAQISACHELQQINTQLFRMNF